MVIMVTLITAYVVYENTFPSAVSKEALSAHNIVCAILMLLLFVGTCFAQI